MTDSIKKTLNRILSLFPIPKIHPKLYDMEKEDQQITLLGEINTENIKSMSAPSEWMKEHLEKEQAMSRPNRGKEFESRIKEAFEKIPNTSIDRIPDQMSGRKGSTNVSDFIMYHFPYQYYIECKAFYGNTINFYKISQLDDLVEKAKILGVSAGCMLWFIDHDITVWIYAEHLHAWHSAGNKSVNIKDIKENLIPYRIIPGYKKRVFFEYDMKPFLGKA